MKVLVNYCMPKEMNWKTILLRMVPSNYLYDTAPIYLSYYLADYVSTCMFIFLGTGKTT